MTMLEQAIAALTAAPDDEALNRGLYACLAASEMVLLLETEPSGDRLKPMLFPLSTGPVACAFDSEEKLADFSGAAPFAAMPGRALVELLAGRGVGLTLNLGAEHTHLLPPEALDWLATATVLPTEAASQPIAIHPPNDLPDALLPQLEARLASASGLARKTVLAQAEYATGTRRPMVAFIGAIPGAETALTTTIGEAIALLGTDPSDFDLAFLPERGPATDRLLANGLVIDLPEPAARNTPPPPGSDPTRPPKLR